MASALLAAASSANSTAGHVVTAYLLVGHPAPGARAVVAGQRRGGAVLGFDAIRRPTGQPGDTGAGGPYSLSRTDASRVPGWLHPARRPAAPPGARGRFPGGALPHEDVTGADYGMSRCSPAPGSPPPPPTSPQPAYRGWPTHRPRRRVPTTAPPV
ncbi:hypothetical protein Srufu_002940 [Streptomyces libani subsp. rufus]|nr:hypothetical protein Srufu_002940 [Streptomyces libani subsp. rufus]